MDITKGALEKKFELIQNSFAGQDFFKVEDVQSILIDISKATLYWYLSKMVDKGYIKRIGKGKYTVNKNLGLERPIYSHLADIVNRILEETGFRYFISGLDVLLKYMQHVPDNFPVMLFVDKFSKEEIEGILLQNQITVIDTDEIKRGTLLSKLNILNEFVIIYKTENLDYSTDGFATRERAFVDLYYEVTRREYPVSIQELVRTYVNMISAGALDKKLLIKVANLRGIHYDIRFIIESKHINKAAFDFVNMIRGERSNDFIL